MHAGQARDSASTALETVTFAVADGYDAKQGKTLVQDGKLYLLQGSDNDRFQVEGGYWLSLRFAGSVPAGATIQSVKVGIERHEEEQVPRRDLVAGRRRLAYEPDRRPLAPARPLHR